MVMDGHIPPYSQEAEAAVLGAILMDNKAIKLIRSIVKPDDFYVEAHRLIYSSIVEFTGPVDVVTLAEELRRRGDLEKAGGAMGIGSLVDAVATASNADHYAQIVSDKALSRQMIYAAQEIAARGLTSTVETRDYLRESLASIKSVAINDNGSSTAVTASEQAPDALRRALSQEPVPGVVMSRIDPIDKILGGFYPKPYLIVGRPSMGKSSVALNIVSNACMAGKRGIVASFEEDTNDVMWRLMAIRSQVPIESIYRRTVNAEQAENLRVAEEIIRRVYNLTIVDRIMSAQEFSDFCEMENEKERVDFIVVDMLAKARSDEKKAYDRVSGISFELSQIPKLIGAPLIATHQLNRAVESRDDKMPMLSDLRDSGKLEEDFKGIIIVMRPWVYDNSKNENEMCIRVAKNTNGRTGNTKAYCNMPTLTIKGELIDERY